MGKLTAKQVEHAKPGRHCDGKGLYLLVKPTAEWTQIKKKQGDNEPLTETERRILLAKPAGAKSWVLRVVVKGHRRDYGLGPVDLVKLTEARDKAVEGRRLVREGKDPGIEWKRAEGIPTFQMAARQYHEKERQGWRNAKHAAQWLSTLETYAFPSIGKRTVDTIDASTIWGVLGPIWQEKPETARRVRQRITKILDWSKAKGWRDTEGPRHELDEMVSTQLKKSSHFAAMPYSELPAFMAKLRSEPSSVGRMALQFLILTAARSGEVRGDTWDETDLDRALWHIPGERMKGGNPHSVPLSAAAVSILREAQGLVTGRKNELVFPGFKGNLLSDATLSKALRTAGGGKCTPHGMRSAFRDWVAERTNFPGEWAEAALAHAVQNKVEAAYRRTKFLEQRAKLMEAWADFLGGSSNVVQLVAAQ